MRISAIVAMSENRVIGKNNEMPWHLPADLKHFKQVTMGRPILMGRKTYESIGRALPGRYNIVVTRDVNFQAPGCLVTNSLDTAIAAVSDADEVFVIGGAQFYQQMLPRVQRLYLTIIHEHIEGDTYFPEINLNDWYELERIDHQPDEQNPYSYSFFVLDRKE